MNRYLRSIGFKNIIMPAQLRKLENDAVGNPSKRFFFPLHNNLDYIEYYKEYGESIGISVRGIIDGDSNVKVKQLFPYRRAKIPVEVYIESAEEDNKGEFYVNCIDVKNGNNLAFYLQNVYEYKKNPLTETVREAYISGLSELGKILLPIERTDDANGSDEESLLNCMKIVEAVKTQEICLSAIFDKTINERTGETIWDKIKEYDILSIVDTYMIPHVEEPCVYSVLGKITSVKQVKNIYSNEEIYIISILITGMVFDICINSTDLVGFPTSGMRFMGTCFLQGFL